MPTDEHLDERIGLCNCRCAGISGRAAALLRGQRHLEHRSLSGDWNTAANWVPNTVPNGPGDIATFHASDVTNLSMNTTSVEVSNIVFKSGAPPFTITVDSGNGIVNLDITGSGIVNNSGVVQSFNGGGQTGIFFTNGTAGSLTSFVANGGLFSFDGSASAGSASYDVNSVGILPAQLFFFDTSMAADATITACNFGEASFNDSTTAGNAVFTAITGGFILFETNSSADHAVATCSGAPGTVGSEIGFTQTATAAEGRFTANGATASGDASGLINFSDSTTAADATFVINGGTVQDAAGAVMTFFGSASAGNATITVNGGSGGGEGGTLFFNGQSDGGTASLALFGNGQLDIAGHGPRLLTVGSLEGDRLVFLGARALAVGSNSGSTTFSGIIQNGGSGGGTGGSLTKVGTGTLTLSSANTYTGGTTVTVGALKVSNTSGSGTGAGPVQVSAGTLGGKGIIAGAVTVGTGSGTGAFLEPSFGASKPTTLTIQSALTFKADGTYTYKLNTKRARADQVVANGVTIESGAEFSFTAVANKRLTTGTVFTAISNTAAISISGTFANLPDGSIFTVGRNNFQVSYSGGDGNDLTLTVVP
jgi:autotransporter-associated beta strand protein